MGAFKVDSDVIWEDYVKNGEVKGFSIEGLFEHSLVQASKKEISLYRFNRRTIKRIS